MADIAPLIAVWAVLCLVLVGYVAYRLMTDKSNGSARHRLYPLVSNAHDPAVPPRGAWLEWLAYVCLMLALSGMLVQLGAESGLLPSSAHVVSIAGPALLIGLVLLAVAVARRRK